MGMSGALTHNHRLSSLDNRNWLWFLPGSHWAKHMVLVEERSLVEVHGESICLPVVLSWGSFLFPQCLAVQERPPMSHFCELFLSSFLSTFKDLDGWII